MKLKGILLACIVSCCLFVGAVNPTNDFNEKERLILNAVVNYLEALHFKPVIFDDDFSEKAFDNYIQMVDPGKRFLIQSEIDALSEYKLEIDDQVNMRSFEFFEASIPYIDESRKRAKRLFNEIIVSDLDVVASGDIEMDSDKRTFVQSEGQLKALWERIIKYDYNSRLYTKIRNQERRLEKRAEKDFEVEKKENSKSLEEVDEDILVDAIDAAIEEAEEKEFVIKTEEEMKAEVVKAIKKSYDNWFSNMDKDRRSDKFETYVNSITHLFDPHSDYLNPKEKEDFDIRMGGKLEGIGARLSTEDDLTKVVAIIPGGPAWKGKELQVDDFITAVRQKDAEAISVEGMRLDDVVQMIRGDKGTIVFLSVKKPDGSIVEIEIERDEVKVDDAFARSLILDIPDEVSNIGYIRLPKFYSTFENEGGNSCAADVKKELEKLKSKNVNGVILDLRNNGGGSLQDVIEMSGLFIEDGPIVQVKPRDREAFVYEDEDKSVHYDGPLIVMVNQFSASASEILAAALQDYGRAVIVGSNSTFGKGTVQRFVNLDRAYRNLEDAQALGNLKITMQNFYRVNGGSTQLKGVIPDVILPDNYHYIETGEKDYDNALEWTEIEGVPHSQNVYPTTNVDKVARMSKNRVNNSEEFLQVLENAERLKRNRDESIYPLDYEDFVQLNKKREEEAKKYENLFDEDIENLSVANLEEDIEYINLDESRIARNEDWIDGVKKDIYLEEVLLIMKDMIRLNKENLVKVESNEP